VRDDQPNDEIHFADVALAETIFVVRGTGAPVRAQAKVVAAQQQKQVAPRDTPPEGTG